MRRERERARPVWCMCITILPVFRAEGQREIEIEKILEKNGAWGAVELSRENELDEEKKHVLWKTEHIALYKKQNKRTHNPDPSNYN